MSSLSVSQQVYQLPHAVLAAALPHLRPFDVHNELRREFALWVVGQRGEFDNWQQAWNTWTGAQRSRPGSVSLSVRCRECRGQLISRRHGVPHCCTACHGRRREQLRSPAIWQEPPA